MQLQIASTRSRNSTTAAAFHQNSQPSNFSSPPNSSHIRSGVICTELPVFVARVLQIPRSGVPIHTRSNCQLLRFQVSTSHRGQAIRLPYVLCVSIGAVLSPVQKSPSSPRRQFRAVLSSPHILHYTHTQPFFSRGRPSDIMAGKMTLYKLVVLGDGGVGKTALTIQVSTTML